MLRPRFQIVWLIVYGVLLTVVTGGMFRMRAWAIRELDSPAAAAHWEEWRDKAQKQAKGDGPVTRKVPVSAMPPTLVLLRNHFATCMVGAWLFSSVLFVIGTVLVRGVLMSKTTIHPD